MLPGRSRLIRIKIHVHLIRTNFEVVCAYLNANQTASTWHRTEFDPMPIRTPWFQCCLDWSLSLLISMSSNKWQYLLRKISYRYLAVPKRLRYSWYKGCADYRMGSFSNTFDNYDVMVSTQKHLNNKRKPIYSLFGCEIKDGNHGLNLLFCKN